MVQVLWVSMVLVLDHEDPGSRGYDGDTGETDIGNEGGW